MSSRAEDPKKRGATPAPARPREASDPGENAGPEPAPRPADAERRAKVVSLGRVNRAAAGASNSKETRAKEAEEDRALIARAQAGDTVAFRSLVERHQRRAFSIALSLVRDENDARELVQDAFLRVYKNLGNFQGQSSFFTWLYRIITNLSIDLIRKPGRQVAQLDDSRHDQEETREIDFPFVSRIDGSDPSDVVRRGEIAARLQQALDALPDYHRGVIVMREVEGLSYEEMAQAMGVSKGTIMSRLFHARQKLQRALVDCYQEQVRGPELREAAAEKSGRGEGEESS